MTKKYALAMRKLREQRTAKNECIYCGKPNDRLGYSKYCYQCAWKNYITKRRRKRKLRTEAMYNVAVVGIGQAGSNITKCLEDMGYDAMYINTSPYDLEYISSSNKLHIPGAEGCARDTQLAVSLLEAHYELVLQFLKHKLLNKKYVWLNYSLGGGTGAGLGPALADLIKMKLQDDIVVGCGVIIPQLTEPGYLVKKNAIDSVINTLQAEVGNVFLIDNNCGKAWPEINQTYARMFDAYINMTQVAEGGIIDNREIHQLRTVKGIANLITVDESGEIVPSVFCEAPKGCKYIAYSFPRTGRDDEIITKIESKYGVPVDSYIGYSGNNNTLVAVVGCPIPNEPFLTLRNIAVESMGRHNEDHSNSAFSVEPIKLETYTTISIPQKEIVGNNPSRSPADIFKKYR